MIIKNIWFQILLKAAGGCSAPSLADMDAVMARLGKMKMKFIETSAEKNLIKHSF